MTLWERFKMDFKERFLNFETVKGIYLFPFCAVGLYVTIFHIQFMLQAIGVTYFSYGLVEAIRKISVNRIKQQTTVRKLIDMRKQFNTKLNRIFDVPGTPETPALHTEASKSSEGG